MPAISIRTMLAGVAMIALAIAGLLNPNQHWVQITDIVVIVVLLLSISISVGGDGRRRVAVVAFLASTIFCFIAVRFSNSPVHDVIQTSSNQIYQMFESTFQQSSPDGTDVYLGNDGEYQIRYANMTGWVSVSVDDIEKGGLASFAVTDSTSFEEEHFLNIYQNFAFLLVGFCCSIVAIVAYDSRKSDQG